MVDNCAKIETIKIATVRQFVLVGIVCGPCAKKIFLAQGLSHLKRRNVTTIKAPGKIFFGRLRGNPSG